MRHIEKGDKYIIEVSTVSGPTGDPYFDNCEVTFREIDEKFYEYDVKRLEKFEKDKYISIDILRELTKLSYKERKSIFGDLLDTDAILSKFTPSDITQRIKKYRKDGQDCITMDILRQIINLPNCIRKELFDGEYDLEKILQKYSCSYITYTIDNLKEKE